ncbi:serine hydrolase domain-containing protein [Streptomyces sp. NPDC005820]|uniref:serine hydrolase domain-containing protein n=1 Tax=Streptomyces sp. NPDC005820 TaxID=3157069 RepID=UPI0033CE950B
MAGHDRLVGRLRVRDPWIEEIVAAGFLGVELRVKDERGEWVGSAGARGLGRSTEPLTGGHFRVGSSTESFVATVVLMLVAEGRIGLDRRITVRMLLQHTSGIFNHTGELYEDGTNVPGVTWRGKERVDNRFHTYLPEELVRLSLSKPARFAPGTDWSYANTNYVLARPAIEKVTGRSFAEELRRLILGPLGTTGTVAPGTSSEIPEPHHHSYLDRMPGLGFSPDYVAAQREALVLARAPAGLGQRLGPVQADQQPSRRPGIDRGPADRAHRDRTPLRRRTHPPSMKGA